MPLWLFYILGFNCILLRFRWNFPGEQPVWQHTLHTGSTATRRSPAAAWLECWMNYLSTSSTATCPWFDRHPFGDRKKRESGQQLAAKGNGREQSRNTKDLLFSFFHKLISHPLKTVLVLMILEVRNLFWKTSWWMRHFDVFWRKVPSSIWNSAHL